MKRIFIAFSFIIWLDGCNSTSSESGSGKSTVYSGKITAANIDLILTADTNTVITDTCLSLLQPYFPDSTIYPDTSAANSFFRSALPMNCQSRVVPQETIYVRGMNVFEVNCSSGPTNCTHQKIFYPFGLVNRTIYLEIDTISNISNFPVNGDSDLAILEPYSFFSIASLPPDTTHSILLSTKSVYRILTPALTSSSSVSVSCQSSSDSVQWLPDSSFTSFSDSGFVQINQFAIGCQAAGGYRITVTNP